jgi:hypothetical protein
MSPFSTLTARLNRRMLDQRSSELVECCQDTVWQRVYRNALAMRPPEARGYIRARAAAIVHGEIDRMLRGAATLDAASRSCLESRVVDELIGIVGRRLRHASSRRYFERRAA